jgi:hypothetical protein
MKFSLHQSNGLDALFKSTRRQTIWKCDLNRPNMCFRLKIWPNGHRESHKYDFVKWIPKTNKATEPIILPLIQLKCILCFRVRCLVGPGSTWTSSPKVVPTPLILLGTSLLCTYMSCRVGRNLARVPLPSGISMSRSKSWEPIFINMSIRPKSFLTARKNS